MTEQTKNVLRWTLALPACLLVITAFILGIPFLCSLFSQPMDGYFQHGAQYIGFGFFGWALSAIPVWFIARWIAPNRAKLAAWIMTFLLCIIPVLSIITMIIIEDNTIL